MSDILALHKLDLDQQGWLPALRHAGFLDRAAAEQNAEFRQIIPYVVVTCLKTCLVYRRLSGCGESRLHDRWSLGFGGHMDRERMPFNPVSGIEDDPWGLMDPMAGLLVHLVTELNEELEIPYHPATKLRFLSPLQRSETLVDRVHLGLLFQLTIHHDIAPLVRTKEPDQIELLGFRHPRELTDPKEHEKLEGWSQDALFYLAASL